MRLSNISKSYRGSNGEVTVFDRFSADIPDGEITWIMGESGVGKTTLLRIIAGLEEFTGEIVLPDGGISMVFQEDRLFEHISAPDNCILAYPAASRSEVRAALMAAGLSEDETNRPVKELSGGQKRRTAIVRALLSDAAVILMDEPFKGLDRETRAKTAEIACRLLKGKTVIAVTHDISDTELMGGNIISL